MVSFGKRAVLYESWPDWGSILQAAVEEKKQRDKEMEEKHQRDREMEEKHQRDREMEGNMLVMGKTPFQSNEAVKILMVSVSVSNVIRDQLRGLVCRHLDDKVSLLELEY